MVVVKWLKNPQKHAYPVAESYLRLIFKPQAATTAAENLESVKITATRAKDKFRTSGVSLLGVSNSHVEKDQARVILSECSPLLLFRDTSRAKLISADGYQRLCAVHTFDVDAMIPCKIV